jgi:hypothetical protein
MSGWAPGELATAMPMLKPGCEYEPSPIALPSWILFRRRQPAIRKMVEKESEKRARLGVESRGVASLRIHGLGELLELSAAVSTADVPTAQLLKLIANFLDNVVCGTKVPFCLTCERPLDALRLPVLFCVMTLVSDCRVVPLCTMTDARIVAVYGICSECLLRSTNRDAFLDQVKAAVWERQKPGRS